MRPSLGLSTNASEGASGLERLPFIAQQSGFGRGRKFDPVGVQQGAEPGDDVGLGDASLPASQPAHDLLASRDHHARQRILRLGGWLTFLLAAAWLAITVLYVAEVLSRGWLLIAAIPLWFALAGLILVGRALTRSGPPFDQVRWWWPWRMPWER